MSATTHARDRETVRKACGVRVNPEHWASAMVHAFRTWTGEHELETWCGLAVDLSDGGTLTSDLITCLQCPSASLQAFRRKGAASW